MPYRLRVFFVLLLAACAAHRSEEDIAPDPVWLAHEPTAQTFEDPGPVDLDHDLGLDEVIRLAAERNPRLAGARERWLAAEERPAQERSLPDPLFAYLPMIDHIQTRAGPIEEQYQVTQRIPYPGRLAAAGDVAEEEAKVRDLEYRAAIRDVVADAKVSYAELLYLRKAEKIVEQNRALATQLAEKGAALYGGAKEERMDDVTLFDTLKAQSQLAQLAYDAITLEELRHTEEATLNQLLSRAPDAPLGSPKDLAFRPLGVRREALYALALEHRQELEAALHRIAAAEQAERVARLARVPDFQIGATYTVIGTPPAPVAGGGDNAFGLMFGMTLPIWETRNRARVAEAEYRRAAAAHDRQAMVDELMARISKVYFRLENAERLVRLYGESLVPQAERAMEIAEQWHSTGRDTFGRLLEAQSVWLNFQLAYERALADYEQMVARLEQLTGTSLARFREKGEGAAGKGATEGKDAEGKKSPEGGDDGKK
jgi:cobalt-zinc-cadmium efflux system outer membrane protein